MTEEFRFLIGPRPLGLFLKVGKKQPVDQSNWSAQGHHTTAEGRIMAASLGVSLHFIKEKKKSLTS